MCQRFLCCQFKDDPLCCFTFPRLTVKEEPDDADFVTEKRGKKRKRPKEEEDDPDEGHSKSGKPDKKS